MNGSGVLTSIGNTPFIELRNVVPDGSGRVRVKLESQNATGSMKDRMALAVVHTGLNERRTVSDA